MSDIISTLKEKYSGKKVLVVGLGLQGGGVGVAKFFAEQEAIVTVTDKKTKEHLIPSIEKLNGLPIIYHLGGHQMEDFINADVIFKGPSVHWDMPEIVAAQKKNIPIEMELSFFTAYCPAKIIGVTGTRGKSTTTNMIYRTLKQNGLRIYLAGGMSGVSTIDLLKTITNNDWVVMELSSWALSGFHQRKISPHIAVFTNFYPDHLNYYENMEDYLYDKQAIYSYQKPEDYLVINKNLLSYNLEHPQGAQAQVIFTANDFPDKLEFLKGEHNRENAASALAVAKILKLDMPRCINELRQFKGIPFRQEIIKQKEKIIFVNDTASTTPVATIKALEVFNDKPVYLILGGQGKNLPFTDLINQLIKIKKIILLKGSFTDEILPSLKEKYADKITAVYDDMREAILEAYRLAKTETNGAYVLFSPAATSFAMFNNEFHRGEEFNKVVNAI